MSLSLTYLAQKIPRQMHSLIFTKLSLERVMSPSSHHHALWVPWIWEIDQAITRMPQCQILDQTYYLGPHPYSHRSPWAPSSHFTCYGTSTGGPTCEMMYAGLYCPVPPVLRVRYPEPCRQVNSYLYPHSSDTGLT